MYRVSDDEVEFILNDIKQRGVEMEDLQNNLLDHICCLLEKEKQENEDFETAYQKVIKQFFKHALWEIEEETILLLKYKNYYKMKRLLYILLFLSLGYNVFMFSRMGYDLYKSRKWISEHMNDTKSTFKSGLKDLSKKIIELDIKVPKKDYTCIYFLGEPNHFGEEFAMDVDTEYYNPKKIEAGMLRRYTGFDSVAGVYNKNINHFFCFEGTSSATMKRIKELSPKFKNIVFIPGMNSLLSGYFNDKKNKVRFTPKIFVIDSDNKLIYDNTLTTNEFSGVAKFFQTISK